MQAQQNSAPEWGPYGTVGRTIVRFNLPGDPRLSQLVRLADAIDALTDTVGRCCAWLVLAVIVLLFLQLPLREVVQGGHILANDFGQLTHAAVFMVGLSYALRWDRHVRMDVFYRGMGERARATRYPETFPGPARSGAHSPSRTMPSARTTEAGTARHRED